jgi:protease I
MTAHGRPVSLSGHHAPPEPGDYARLTGKRIGILMESDFYEDEILYYKHRFPEEGLETHFLTRLWGQPRLTFTGHEHKMPFEVSESFEGMSDDELRSYAAIIVPSAIVSDRLRYTEDVNRPAPAVELLRRAFAEPSIVKGIICHGMWLVSPAPELVRGRPVVCHNNLIGDVRNMGAVYTDQDVVIDDDLVTARTGGHCHQFARAIIETLVARSTEGGGESRAGSRSGRGPASDGRRARARKPGMSR